MEFRPVMMKIAEEFREAERTETEKEVAVEGEQH